MSVIWPQIGSNINGDYPDDLFGNSISLSDDGTIVAIGATWYDDGSIAFTAATNLVTIAGHNYSYNDEISFAGITGGIGLGDGEKYYVVNVTTNTFQLSLTQGPTIMTFGPDGTADGGWTFTADTNLVTKNGHGYIYGDEIAFSNVSSGLSYTITNGTVYYVINPTTNTFQLSSSAPSALSIIPILGDGSATTTVTVDSDNQSNKGSVQIWKNTAGTWGQLGSTIVGENYRDKFGQSVALNAAGTRVASGARGAVNGNGLGRVRVFEYNVGTTTWDLLGNNIDPVDTAETVVLDKSESTVNYTSHGYNNNDAIKFDSGISNITNLNDYTIYYVVYVDANTFQLSSTYGGSAITFAGSDDNAAVIKNFSFHTGVSIALNNTGDIIAVGSPRTNAPAGAATLYKLVGSTWTKMGRSIVGHNNSEFGSSISLNGSGSTVAIGGTQGSEIGMNVANPDGGYVGIYENSGLSTTASWIQKGPLIHAVDDETYTIDGSTNFLTRTAHGFSDGNQIAFATITTTTEISAYIGYYVINKTADSFQLSLSEGSTTVIGLTSGSATRNSGVQFGYSVSLNNTGDIVAIGAISSKNASGSSVGQVNIYKYNSVGPAWDLLGSAIDGSVLNDNLGYSVALNPEADGTDGNTFVAIGVPGVNNSDSGHVEIYTYNGSAWSQYHADINGDTGGDKFGASVSMNADGTIVAGGATIMGGYADTYTTTGSTDLFTFTNHGFVNDDRISFSAFVDTSGPSVGTPYYVKSANTNTFQISETSSGGANSTVNLNNNGTAIRTSYGIGYAKVNTVPTVPGAPTITSATPLDASTQIAFTAGTDNGAPATNYEYSIDGGSATAIGQTISPFTITGLSNGTSYDIKLRAVTASLGSSSYSSEVSVTPLAVPSAPTIDSITANSNGSVSVAFTPGAANGSAITDYKYKIDSGSLVSVGSTSSPFTISSGLSLGTNHAIIILAVNSAGDGAASSATSVIPATAPSAPTITDDTTGDNNSAIIHFTAGASNGRDITNYKYSVGGATAVELGNTTTPFTITSLTNGQTYSITLYAYNAMGWSSVSAAKNVTPTAVPGSPTINTTTPGNQQIDITFTPGNNNGSTITNYEYSINSGSSWTARDPVSVSSPIIITGLTNGTPYVVMLRAVNANGSGPSASSSSVIPVTTPSAPTNVQVFPGNTQAIVTYDNSASTGGSSIIRYEQSTDNGVNWAGFGGSTMELVPRPIITGLTNNQTYQVKVRAVNAVGGGTPSSPAIELIPLPVPGAPLITGLIPGNASASVEFTAGDAFGTTITTYEYSTDGGSTWTARSPSATTSPIEIIGLTNGQSYQVRIRAVNSSGSGTSSNAFTAEPVSEATAPTVTSISSGDKQMSIFFTAGAEWGSPATNYDYSLDNGENWVSMSPAQTTSPLIITGLTNGTSYTVIIRTRRGGQVDDVTSSPTVVIPATFPDAPSISVVSGNLSAIITITDGSNNGRSITNYQYSIDNGSTWTIRSPASDVSPLTLTGLAFDQTYQIKLKSYNQMGWSSESTAKSVTIAKKPDAPIINSATASNGKVTIVFTAGNTNNLPLTNYKYSTDNGVTLSDRSPASTTSPFEITGLTNGTEYKIILYAINNAGVGAGSETQLITLPSPSDAPTIVVNSGYESLSISITPGKDNGSPITNYQYTIDNGINWVTRSPVSAESPLIITGLTNGQLYQVALKAINAIGISAASSTGSARPESVPGPPTITSATPNDKKIAVVFTPGAENGFTILNYQYSLDNASTWITRAPVSITSPLEISGLVNGQTYQVRLRATNINGNSPESNLISVTPATYPDPPAITSVTPNDQSAIISFTAGSNNGEAITNYQYSVDNGSTWANRTPVSANSPLIITGLTNGKTYEIKLRAVNSIGYGNATVMYPVIPFSDVPEPVLTVGPNNTIIVPTYGLEVLTSGTPAENRTMRIKFIKALLTDNATLITGNKLLIDTKTLLGESTLITKQYVRILNTYTTIPILPTVERFKLSVLESDEGIYLPLDDINDSIILQLTEGNFNWFMKFVKATVTQYQVYEDYGNINTPITSVKTIGDTGNHRYFSYIIDSVSGEYNPPPSPVPICFPKGTPVSTDQGNIDIEKIIPNVHTIRGKQIVAITKTIPNHADIVSISKDAFERNIPSKKTIISQEHKVVYKNRLIKAKDLVNCCEGVTMIPYDGKPLYNVLMKQYDYMMINNLTCETLHPESIMSKIYNSKFTYTEQNLICSDLTNVLASNNAPAYNKLCNSIRYFEREKGRGRNVDIRVGYHGIGSSIYSKQK